MKYFKRSDLACEKSYKYKSDYNTFTKDLYGIEAICSYHKSDAKRANIILCIGRVWMYNEEFRMNVSLILSNYISYLAKRVCADAKKILIVGLGNRSITSDALGPYVTDCLFPTVNIKKYKNSIYILTPGVEGQSGFKTSDAVRYAAKKADADLILIIDSLCAKSLDRLVSTVQLSTEGILPGSGVGNHKEEISKRTMSVPVISVGVPTVADLGAVVGKEAGFNFYISPNNIDLSVKSASKIITLLPCFRS